MVKKTTPTDEKLEKQDFELFEALAALDKKDYAYFDRLTEEQQKKFVPFMMTHWMSQIKSNGGLSAYYVRSVDYYANQHLFNEAVMKHPKLQWLMLCASSPDMGKQFHQWVPHISAKITGLKEVPKEKEMRDYFQKIYPKASEAHIYQLGETFVEEQKKKVYLATQFPELKRSDIETLAQMITDDDIRDYEKARGN